MRILKQMDTFHCFRVMVCDENDVRGNGDECRGLSMNVIFLPSSCKEWVYETDFWKATYPTLTSSNGSFFFYEPMRDKEVMTHQEESDDVNWVRSMFGEPLVPSGLTVEQIESCVSMAALKLPHPPTPYVRRELALALAKQMRAILRGELEESEVEEPETEETPLPKGLI